MLVFILCAAALVIVTLLILSPALFNRTKLRYTDLEQQNIAIAKERLAAIDADTNSESTTELEATLICWTI